MEQEAISTITAKNQTTIPRAVRRKLNLVPGDQLSYVIKSDGNVSIKKVKPKTDKMWQIAYQQEKSMVVSILQKSIGVQILKARNLISVSPRRYYLG